MYESTYKRSTRLAIHLYELLQADEMDEKLLPILLGYNLKDDSGNYAGPDVQTLREDIKALYKLLVR